MTAVPHLKDQTGPELLTPQWKRHLAFSQTWEKCSTAWICSYKAKGKSHIKSFAVNPAAVPSPAEVCVAAPRLSTPQQPDAGPHRYSVTLLTFWVRAHLFITNTKNSFWKYFCWCRHLLCWLSSGSCSSVSQLACFVVLNRGVNKPAGTCGRILWKGEKNLKLHLYNVKTCAHRWWSWMGMKNCTGIKVQRPALHFTDLACLLDCKYFFFFLLPYVCIHYNWLLQCFCYFYGQFFCCCWVTLKGLI